MNDKFKESYIAITGAFGFIGSCMVSTLNNNGFYNLILVDDFSKPEKERNLAGKIFIEKVDREIFFNWLDTTNNKLYCIIHLGARTNTRELNYEIHKYFNEEYSKKIWHYCAKNSIKLIYASSAATYGSANGLFLDKHSQLSKLEPLNPYAISKNNFDKWAIEQTESPPSWIGLKFFNVYGPNEFHKNGMASMVYHTYNQIVEKGNVKLFKSYNPHFLDGEQQRDFIYVKDIVKVVVWLLIEEISLNGIFNLGTGEARTFNDLVEITFRIMSATKSIEYIDMPRNLKNYYQYFTKANISKLKSLGYKDSFFSLEKGIEDYVNNYLQKGSYY